MPPIVLLTALLPGLLLVGCAVGPDFTTPAGPATSGYTPERLRSPGAARVEGAGPRDRRNTGGQVFALGHPVPDQWWRAFGSRDLDVLVEDALAANPTIDTARSAIAIARDNAISQRGALYPQLGLNLGYSRQKTSLDLSQPLSNSNNYTYDLYAPALGATYTPDLFGGTRRQVEALDAQTDNQRFQFEQTRLTLITSVVAAAIQEASLRGQVEAAREVIGLGETLLGLARRQLALGQANGADVEQQAALLYQSQQLLPPLEKQLAQQRNALTAMVGRLPADEIRQRFTLGSLRLPATLPVSLPADLVRNRPDIRAAEATLHETAAQVGVAVANRFPQLTLTANAGLNAARVASLVAPGAQFYVLASSLTAPLFDANTLFYRQKAAEETFNQAETQYRSTVISAFQNVADALRALQADSRYVAAARAGSLSARRSVELTRRQLESGSVPTATLLIAQQVFLQALINDVQAQATRLNDTASLFQALGGGWQNRPAPELAALDRQ